MPSPADWSCLLDGAGYGPAGLLIVAIVVVTAATTVAIATALTFVIAATALAFAFSVLVVAAAIVVFIVFASALVRTEHLDLQGEDRIVCLEFAVHLYFDG